MNETEDLIGTVQMFIDELSADLEAISGEIREATYWEDCHETVEWLSGNWDEKDFHLKHLIKIKEILQNGKF
jgi:hypothetical protein